MRIHRPQIISLIAAALVVGGFTLAPHQAHAGFSFWPSADSMFDSFIALFFDFLALPLANMFLQITGYLLNTTLTLTLHMNSMVSASGGIVDTTWAIIRDISSILIIFFLLIASIQLILGLKENTLKKMIVMVAIAGILMNFSLFFTKVLVDASNVVSLAIYDAIIPPGGPQYNGTGDYLTSAINDGGLSNVFMNALEIQKIYEPATTGANTGSTMTTNQTVNTSPIAVFAAGAGGTIVMFIAALSFLAAAILFAVRIGFLILLMAFSSVYFLGLIFPGQLKKDLSDRWLKALTNQLIVLPIYLFFLYVALRVITDPTFKSVLNPAAPGNTSGAIINAGVVGTVIQYIIAIMLINIPLFAALTFASVGKDFAEGATSKIKGWGKTGLQKGWQNSGGRIATRIGDSEAMHSFAQKNALGKLTLGGLDKIGSGYAKKREEKEKADEKFQKRLGTVRREYYKSDEEFEDAQHRALQRQKTLPYDLRNRTLIGNLLTGSNSTMSRGSAYKLRNSKEFKKADKKLDEERAKERAEGGDYKGNRTKIDNQIVTHQESIESHKSTINNLNNRLATKAWENGNPLTTAQINQLQVQKGEIEKQKNILQQEIAKLKETRKQYEEKTESDTDKILQKIEEFKNESDSGSKDNKGEKTSK